MSDERYYDGEWLYRYDLGEWLGVQITDYLEQGARAMNQEGGVPGVEDADLVCDESRQIATEIANLVRRGLLSREPPSAMTMELVRGAGGFLREIDRYTSLITALFTLSADELISAGGDPRALGNLAEEKARDTTGKTRGQRRLGPTLFDQMRESKTLNLPARSLFLPIEEYPRLLELMSRLTPEELREVAGDRGALEGLVQRLFDTAWPGLLELAVADEQAETGIPEQQQVARAQELFDLLNRRCEPIVTNRPREELLLKLVWDETAAAIARADAEHLNQKANRALALSDLFARAEATGTTLTYLRHVARCFVCGFDQECIILCRSALESALKDADPDEDSKEITLEARIGRAQERGLLSGPGKDAADEVRRAGNNVVHNDPMHPVSRHPFWVIRRMLLAVTELCSQ